MFVRVNFRLKDPPPVWSDVRTRRMEAGFSVQLSTPLMNKGNADSVLAGKFDLEKIGAMGHSVGGAAAHDLAFQDSRVKAVIDLDGVVYDTPNVDAENAAPILMLANDKYHVQAIKEREQLLKRFEEMDDLDRKITVELYVNKGAYQDAYNKAQQNVLGLTEVLKANNSLYTSEGSDHMKFTDTGLFIGASQLREMVGSVRA